MAGGEPRPSRVSDEIHDLDVVSFPIVWRPNRLLVLAGTTIEGVNIYSVPISDEGRIGRPADPLTAGPGMTWSPSVSDDGRIALTRFSWVIHLWEVELDPRTGEAAGAPKRITDDAAPKFSFSLTRNGERLAYSTYSGHRGDRRAEIVVQDLDTGMRNVPVTLTENEVATSTYPVFSGDGAMLSWLTKAKGSWVAWVAPLAAPLGVELFLDEGGQVLIKRGPRLLRIDPDSHNESPLFELEDRALLEAALSRDGRWLAILTGETDGSLAIDVVQVGDAGADPASAVEIASGPHWVGAPRWSADGKTMYYLSDRDDFICVWGQHLDAASKKPVGEAFPVVHAHSANMQRLPFARFMWTLEVGGNRLVLNAGEMTGDVYTALLPEN
jgi:hypothetical protein